MRQSAKFLRMAQNGNFNKTTKQGSKHYTKDKPLKPYSQQHKQTKYTHQMDWGCDTVLGAGYIYTYLFTETARHIWHQLTKLNNVKFLLLFGTKFKTL